SCGVCLARWWNMAARIASSRSMRWRSPLSTPLVRAPQSPGKGHRRLMQPNLPVPTTVTQPGITPDFEAFRKRAYQITGLDLTSYKAPQMHRRLSALLTRLQITDFTAYSKI